jgi:MGT family glycosyltransferase
MNAKHYLFVTFEGGGNVPPVLGAARRMVERGHAVTVLTEPCLEEAVRATGADFTPFRRYFDRTDRTKDLIADWDAKSPPAAIARAMQNVCFGPAPETAAEVLRVVDGCSPDALVVDWMLPAAVAVGEARGLPTATLVHCVNMMPGPGRPSGPMAPAQGWLGRLRDRGMNFVFSKIVSRHAPAYNALRQQLGLEPLRDILAQFDRVDRTLVQTSAAFDFLASPEPEHRVYVGPVLDDPDWATQAWDSPWAPEDERPLVVVSMSSTFQNQRAEIQAAISALGTLPVRGLATLGPAMVDTELEVPDNVVVVPSVPHSLVFPQTAVLIGHCGHGTTMRALAHAIPVVALPMGRDQDATATRIVHHGLGLRPKPTPAGIARAVQTLLRDESYAAAAKEMAGAIERDLAGNRLVTELESMVLARVRRDAEAGVGASAPLGVARSRRHA